MRCGCGSSGCNHPSKPRDGRCKGRAAGGMLATSMKPLLRLSLVLALLAPIAAAAQSNDLAYCGKLYDMAVRYRGKAIMGDMRPTPPMVIAQEQCKGGNTTAGIGTLERILHDGDITPPPR